MKKSGLSIVELLVVIAIIAIITAIAIPSYSSSVKKARRIDAQEELMVFAGDAERIYTDTASYTSIALPANTDFYIYRFPTAVRADSYLIWAIPTTAQNSDKCGVMTLSSTGKKGHTGSESGCW